MQFIAVLSNPTVGRSVSFNGVIIGFISAVYFSFVVVLYLAHPIYDHRFKFVI